MTDDRDPFGPYVVWFDLGVEGWFPVSYNTLDEAIRGDRWSERNWVITKIVNYSVKEVNDD